MIKRLIPLIIAAILSFGSFAQSNVPTLKVTSLVEVGFFSPLDTIYGSQVYTYTITITNLDPLLTYTNDTTSLFSVKMLADSNYGTFSILDDSTPFVITPGDTIIFQTSDTFPSGGFKPGNNVVVVWPSKASGVLTFNADSTFYNIFYAGTSGIKYFDKVNLLVYPNPFFDVLKIDNTADNQLRLFIYDGSGKLVYQNPFDKKTYDLSFLKQGLYFIELRKTNTVVARRKLIKM